jgi:hypothetical protein
MHYEKKEKTVFFRTSELVSTRLVVGRGAGVACGSMMEEDEWSDMTSH